MDAYEAVQIHAWTTPMPQANLIMDMFLPASREHSSSTCNICIWHRKRAIAGAAGMLLSLVAASTWLQSGRGALEATVTRLGLEHALQQLDQSLYKEPGTGGCATVTQPHPADGIEFGKQSRDVCRELCSHSITCIAYDISSKDTCTLYPNTLEITVTNHELDFTCFIKARTELAQKDGFHLVGGVGHACRGAYETDVSKKYYSLMWRASSIDACKKSCMDTKGCKGIEWSRWGEVGRCELWKRPDGIQSFLPKPGNTCLRFGPPTVSSQNYMSDQNYCADVSARALNNPRIQEGDHNRLPKSASM